MGKLPILSGRDIVRLLGRIGYVVVRQKGSHVRLACPGRRSITVPLHPTIGRGLLRKIIRDSEQTIDEFEQLLR